MSQAICQEMDNKLIELMKNERKQITSVGILIKREEGHQRIVTNHTNK